MDAPPADLVAFCEREHPRLVGALTLYCGDPLLAQELAQETLVRVCQRWERVRLLRSPPAWAHRVALNLANSWFRRRAAESRALVRHGPEPSVPPVSPDGVAMRDAVSRLPPPQRQVLVLRFFLGHSAREVAALTGRSPGAVRVLTHRAVTRLRRDFLRTDEETGNVPA